MKLQGIDKISEHLNKIELPSLISIDNYIGIYFNHEISESNLSQKFIDQKIKKIAHKNSIFAQKRVLLINIHEKYGLAQQIPDDYLFFVQPKTREIFKINYYGFERGGYTDGFRGSSWPKMSSFWIPENKEVNISIGLYSIIDYMNSLNYKGLNNFLNQMTNVVEDYCRKNFSKQVKKSRTKKENIGLLLKR